jgi:transposase
MAYLGLVPSEASTGSKRRQGSITKAGNEAARRALVEAAHHYRFPARLSPTLEARHKDQSVAVRTLAWKAQQRLCSRYSHLKRRGKKVPVLVTALARELAGFVWAVACTAMGKAPPQRVCAPAKRVLKEYVLKAPTPARARSKVRAT